MSGDGFQLRAPADVAPTVGERVELGGVRWSQYRAPRDTAPGMFDVEDAGEFQEWL